MDAHIDVLLEVSRWQREVWRRGGVATELYDRVMARKFGGDADIGDLTRKVWEPTPWMIDVFTGDERRTLEIIEWCHAELGSESSPIHERVGSWHRGGAPIHGWTWFGFSSRGAMELFEARWPRRWRPPRWGSPTSTPRTSTPSS